jgi:predicted nucleic acid-binding Zn ribbon protein
MTDPKPANAPDRSPGSVRTPIMVRSCSICGTPLTGRQTVCSPRCRIERSRQRREGKRQERDAKVRMGLREAQHALTEALRLLEPETGPLPVNTASRMGPGRAIGERRDGEPGRTEGFTWK